MSYYKANQQRAAAKWTRRVGYALLPVILFVSVAAGQNNPDSQSFLLVGAGWSAFVLAITEGLGYLIEKIADREARK